MTCAKEEAAALEQGYKEATVRMGIGGAGGGGGARGDGGRRSGGWSSRRAGSASSSTGPRAWEAEEGTGGLRGWEAWGSERPTTGRKRVKTEN